MRWSRITPAKFAIFIAISTMALILSYIWANYMQNSGLFNRSKVAAYSVTAPSNNYLQPVGDIDINQLLEQTNQERIAYNLPVLTPDEGLYKSAMTKCLDMTKKHYWSHYAPDGTSGLSFISQVYPDYLKIGENLATGYNNATEVTAGWMQSPSHRKALLNKDYRYVGFNACTGDVGYGSDSIIIVQHFLTTK